MTTFASGLLLGVSCFNRGLLVHEMLSLRVPAARASILFDVGAGGEFNRGWGVSPHFAITGCPFWPIMLLEKYRSIVICLCPMSVITHLSSSGGFAGLCRRRHFGRRSSGHDPRICSISLHVTRGVSACKEVECGLVRRCLTDSSNSDSNASLKFSIGSQVSSASVYPVHRTLYKYVSLPWCVFRFLSTMKSAA